MHKLYLALVLIAGSTALTACGSGPIGPICRKGCKCGDACIDCSKTCHKAEDGTDLVDENNMPMFPDGELISVIEQEDE
jgi:hypothetical protein